MIVRTEVVPGRVNVLAVHSDGELGHCGVTVWIEVTPGRVKVLAVHSEGELGQAGQLVGLGAQVPGALQKASELLIQMFREGARAPVLLAVSNSQQQGLSYVMTRVVVTGGGHCVAPGRLGHWVGGGGVPHDPGVLYKTSDQCLGKEWAAVQSSNRDRRHFNRKKPTRS